MSGIALGDGGEFDDFLDERAALIDPTELRTGETVCPSCSTVHRGECY